MYLVDTNIFLEVLLSQKRKDETKKLLHLIRKGDLDVYASRFSLYSLELLFANLKRFDELKKFLASIQKFKGLKIISTTPFDDILIVDIVKTMPLDFDNALQFYLVKKYNLKGIISFDTDFDKVTIQRFEPKDLI